MVSPPARDRFDAARLINIANGLTAARIILVPYFAYLLISGRGKSALAVFAVCGATDALDGLLARRLRQRTLVGTLLDPIADKLLICGALISLVELDLAPAWMVVVVVGREFAVSGLRAIASAQGIVIQASGWGKAKMFSQVVAVSLLILALRHDEALVPAKAALWVVVAIAIISGTEYFRRFLQQVVSIDGAVPPPEP